MSGWPTRLVLAGIAIALCSGCASVPRPDQAVAPPVDHTNRLSIRRLPPAAPDQLPADIQLVSAEMDSLIEPIATAEHNVAPSDPPPKLLDIEKDLGESPFCEVAEPVETGCPATLDETQAQCLSATSSSLGNLFEQEALVLAKCQLGGKRTHCANCLLQSVLRYQSIAERNRSAGLALKLYYGLVATYDKERVLESIQAQLSKARQRIVTIQEEDFDLPGDPDEIHRQTYELATQWEELRLRRGELTSQLRAFLGDDFRCSDIQPTSQLDPQVTCLDTEAAIAVACENRADLAALRKLCCCLNEDTLPAARASLGQLSGLLGSQLCNPCGCRRGFPWLRLLTSAKRDDCETNLRKDQICQRMADLEHQIDEEIRHAAYEITVRRNQLRLAIRTVETWSATIERLEFQRETDQSTVFDVTQAQINKSRAENDVINYTLQLKIAEVNYRSSQGLLAIECGYTVCAPHCSCCAR